MLLRFRIASIMDLQGRAMSSPFQHRLLWFSMGEQFQLQYVLTELCDAEHCKICTSPQAWSAARGFATSQLRGLRPRQKCFLFVGLCACLSKTRMTRIRSKCRDSCHKGNMYINS